MSSSIDDSTKRFTFPLPALWLVACFVFQVAWVSSGQDPLADTLAWVWVGSMWAGWSASLWISSSLTNPWLRLVCIVAAGVWHVEWMSIGREKPLLRYLVMFGGYAIVQSIVFLTFRVPAWSLSPLRLQAVETGKRQFKILDLLLITTVTAGFIATAKRYDPLAGPLFWLGLPLVYVSFATIAAGAVLAMVSKHRNRRRLIAVGLVLLVSGSSLCIAWLDSPIAPASLSQFNSGPPRNLYNWGAYFGIQASFLLLLLLLAACGHSSYDTNHSDDACGILR